MTMITDPQTSPDPRDPEATAWDIPPTEYRLCSYKTDLGAVVYDATNPLAWIEASNFDTFARRFGR